MFKLYENLVRPALFSLRAETAHEMGLEALRVGLASRAAQRSAAKRFAVEPFGKLRRFGLEFKNPIGVAAGFDKNGKVVNQLSSLGFGFVEVGTITYEPQRGNDKPRLFRLPKDRALINRMGFNNDGAAAVVNRLKEIEPTCVLGINIGKNKEIPIEAATSTSGVNLARTRRLLAAIAVIVAPPFPNDAIKRLSTRPLVDFELASFSSSASECARSTSNFWASHTRLM